jgi:hypothetical protein
MVPTNQDPSVVVKTIYEHAVLENPESAFFENPPAPTTTVDIRGYVHDMQVHHGFPFFDDVYYVEKRRIPDHPLPGVPGVEDIGEVVFRLRARKSRDDLVELTIEVAPEVAYMRTDVERTIAQMWPALPRGWWRNAISLNHSIPGLARPLGPWGERTADDSHLVQAADHHTGEGKLPRNKAKGPPRLEERNDVDWKRKQARQYLDLVNGEDHVKQKIAAETVGYSVKTLERWVARLLRGTRL